jgi:hypothetical protein
VSTTSIKNVVGVRNYPSQQIHRHGVNIMCAITGITGKVGGELAVTFTTY